MFKQQLLRVTTIRTILSICVHLQLNNEHLQETLQFLMIMMNWKQIKSFHHPMNTKYHTIINKLTNVLPLYSISCVTQSNIRNSPRGTFFTICTANFYSLSSSLPMLGFHFFFSPEYLLKKNESSSSSWHCTPFSQDGFVLFWMWNHCL